LRTPAERDAAIASGLDRLTNQAMKKVKKAKGTQRA